MTRNEAERSAPVGVSGMGAVSALGVGLAATVSGLYAEPCCPALPSRFSTMLSTPVFEVPGLAATPDHPGGLTDQMLLLALDEALAQAGLDPAALRGKAVGVCIGTTVACQLNHIPFYAELRTGVRPDPKPLRNYVDGLPAEWLRRELGLRGPALTVSNACTSGADAIGIALWWIRRGLCDIAIAGGADEMNQVPYDGFNALGVCSSERCRPFDVRRAGLNLGEGAGVVILESKTHGLRRNAPCRWEAAGFGKAGDAFHITQPAPDGAGLEQAVRLALDDAGMPPEAIAFVNAHGTGTEANDRVEAATLLRLFGPELAYMSTKGKTGHTLGAAGALEFIFTALMLERRTACASAGYELASADIPLAPLSADCKLDRFGALSTSLAFGGSNTALAVRLLPQGWAD